MLIVHVCQMPCEQQSYAALMQIAVPSHAQCSAVHMSHATHTTQISCPTAHTLQTPATHLQNWPRMRIRGRNTDSAALAGYTCTRPCHHHHCRCRCWSWSWSGLGLGAEPYRLLAGQGACSSRPRQLAVYVCVCGGGGRGRQRSVEEQEQISRTCRTCIACMHAQARTHLQQFRCGQRLWNICLKAAQVRQHMWKQCGVSIDE